MKGPVLLIVLILMLPDRPALDQKVQKSGPMITPSGLKYQDIKVGEGMAATPGRAVEVHYTGTFPDGKKFDSSLDRKQSFVFELGKGMVIKGWDEGLVGMKEGGKRKLMIPADLAYGARGAGAIIPPNAELHFEVELLKVK
jgi:FKBP-type peptidyl-prolyl cis-trans isomerase